jgi:hypothetical protein
MVAGGFESESPGGSGARAKAAIEATSLVGQFGELPPDRLLRVAKGLGVGLADSVDEFATGAAASAAVDQVTRCDACRYINVLS